MAGEPQSFSHGIDNLLVYLRAYQHAAGSAAYPPKLTREIAWLKDNISWSGLCAASMVPWILIPNDGGSRTTLLFSRL